MRVDCITSPELDLLTLLLMEVNIFVSPAVVSRLDMLIGFSIPFMSVFQHLPTVTYVSGIS